MYHGIMIAGYYHIQVEIPRALRIAPAMYMCIRVLARVCRVIEKGGIPRGTPAFSVPYQCVVK